MFSKLFDGSQRHAKHAPTHTTYVVSARTYEVGGYGLKRTSFSTSCITLGKDHFFSSVENINFNPMHEEEKTHVHISLISGTTVCGRLLLSPVPAENTTSRPAVLFQEAFISLGHSSLPSPSPRSLSLATASPFRPCPPHSTAPFLSPALHTAIIISRFYFVAARFCLLHEIKRPYITGHSPHVRAKGKRYSLFKRTSSRVSFIKLLDFIDPHIQPGACRTYHLRIIFSRVTSPRSFLRTIYHFVLHTSLT